MISLIFYVLSAYCNDAVYQNYNVGGELVNTSASLKGKEIDDLNGFSWTSMMFEPSGVHINPDINKESSLTAKNSKLKKSNNKGSSKLKDEDNEDNEDDKDDEKGGKDDEKGGKDDDNEDNEDGENPKNKPQASKTDKKEPESDDD